MSEASPRRVAELALIAIAAVWGLTLVMVQNAIAGGWPGAALILASIVAADAEPRLRPPLQLPEG
jgi:hypothetical protein